MNPRLVLVFIICIAGVVAQIEAYFLSDDAYLGMWVTIATVATASYGAMLCRFIKLSHHALHLVDIVKRIEHERNSTTT